MSKAQGFTKEQLEAIAKKAKAKLNEKKKHQEERYVTGGTNQERDKAISILKQKEIDMAVKSRINNAKEKAYWGIRRGKAMRKAIEEEVVAKQKERLANEYNTLLALEKGYKKADKVKKKYVKKTLKQQERARAWQQRVNAPMAQYAELIKQDELRKKERMAKIGYWVATILTAGYYAKAQAEKEEGMQNGFL